MNAYEGNEKYIFVSYAHKDSETVLPILDTLQKQGFRLWCDEKLIVGENYNAAIAKHLRDCGAVLFFLSENWMESKYCRNEAAAAIEQFDKKVALLYLESCTVHDEVLMLFIGKHAVRKSDPAYIDKLKSSPALTECIGMTSAPKDTPLSATDEKPTEGLEFELINGGSSYSVRKGSCRSSSVTIPRTYRGKPVTDIRDWAFFSCSFLQSITLPGSIISIGERAFCGCSALTDITIPSSVKSIGSMAFDDCSSLSVFHVSRENEVYTAIGPHLCSKDGKTLIRCAPASVKTHFSIPDGVTTIGSFALCNILSLQNVTIPDSVTAIESSAFLGCTSLLNIVIPQGVANIENRVFNGCTSLTQITVSSENRHYSSIGPCLYSKDGKTLLLYAPGRKEAHFSIQGGTASIQSWAFEGNEHLEDITIPDSVTKIGTGAFYSCKQLKSIIIPSGVRSIDRRAFSKCSLLGSVTFAGDIMSIGADAFADCSALEAINIPSSIIVIESEVFYGCTSLKSVSLPGSITRIGTDAFNGCSALTDIHFGGMKNKWNKIIFDYGWNNNCPEITVHCILGRLRVQKTRS